MSPLRRIDSRPSPRAGALLLAALAVALAVSSCGRKGAAPSDGLAGCWESTDRGNGGIGNTIDLAADGSVAYTLGAIVDGHYRVASDTIVVSVGDSATGGPQTRATQFALAGNTLTVTAPDGAQKQDLAREGKGSGLAGTWAYTHPAGTMAYETYTEDGRFFFRLPMRTFEGTWKVVGDSLELALGGEKPRRAAYGRDGADLVLTDANGVASRYHAADPALAPAARRAPEATPLTPPAGARTTPAEPATPPATR